MKVLLRAASAPWLVFLVVGGLLYAVYPEPVERPLVHIPGAQVSAWLEIQRQQFRAPMTRAQEQQAVERMVMEEILVQEALAHDLQRLPAVQQRLQRLGEFLQPAGSSSGGDAGADRAQRLGLLQSDPVIRNYLVNVMERALVDGAAVELGERELAAYYESRRDEYVEPARLDLQHVFFSADKGRDRADAAAALDRLDPAGPGIDEGDPFFSGYAFRDRSEQQLASEFGPEFARAVFGLEPGRWTGPVRSAYGWHLVRIDRLRSARTPPLDEVRDKVGARLRYDKKQALLQQRLRELRLRYDVVVEAWQEQGAAS